MPHCPKYLPLIKRARKRSKRRFVHEKLRSFIVFLRAQFSTIIAYAAHAVKEEALLNGRAVSSRTSMGRAQIKEARRPRQSKLRIRVRPASQNQAKPHRPVREHTRCYQQGLPSTIPPAQPVRPNPFRGGGFRPLSAPAVHQADKQDAGGTG